MNFDGEQHVAFDADFNTKQNVIHITEYLFGNFLLVIVLVRPKLQNT